MTVNIDVTTIKSKFEAIIEEIMRGLDFSQFKTDNQMTTTQTKRLETIGSRLDVIGSPTHSIAKILFDSTIRSLISKIIVKDVNNLISSVSVVDRPEKSCLEAKGLIIGDPLGNDYGLGSVFAILDHDATQENQSKSRVVKMVPMALPDSWSKEKHLSSVLEAFNNQVTLAQKAHAAGIGPQVLDSFVCYQDFGISYGFIVEERIIGLNLKDWAKSKSVSELSEMRGKVRDMIKKMHEIFTHNNMWFSDNIIIDSNSRPYVVGLSRATANPTDEGEDELERDADKKRDYFILRLLLPKKSSSEASKDRIRKDVVEYIVMETIRKALEPSGFLTLS